MTRKYEELLDRRALSAAEIADVVQALESPEPDVFVSRPLLLEILGRAGAVEERAVVERFLDEHEDPSLVEAALHVLCDHWQLTADYLGRLQRFVEGEPWDEDSDVQLVALGSAGEFLREQRERRLLFALINVLDSNDGVIRNAAYSALGRAMGRDWDATTDLYFMFEKDADPTVREEALARAVAETSAQ